MGCATAQKMQRLRVGMHRQDVLAILGQPKRTSETDGAEYLRYYLREKGHRLQPVEYFVHLKDDQVDVFGRVSDFHNSGFQNTSPDEEE